MKWTDIPAGTYHGALDRLWVAFGDNADTIATRINTDPAFLGRMVTFALGSVRKKAPKLHLRFSMPPEIAMVAAVYRTDSDPTVEFAIYRNNFDAGKPDTSLVSEGDFGELRVRNFFPGSGCGFILRDGKIDFIEPGLRNFEGKYAKIMTIQDVILLIVWENKESLLSPDTMAELREVMYGFPLALR